MRLSRRIVLVCLALMSSRCNGHGRGASSDAGVHGDSDAQSMDAALPSDAGADEDTGAPLDATTTMMMMMMNAGTMAMPTHDAGRDAGTDSGRVEPILDAGPPSDIQPSDAPKELAKGLCRAFAACLGPVLELAYFNGQDCDDFTARQQTDRELRFLLASISERRMIFRPTLFATCQGDLEKQGCSVQSSRLPASCEQTLEGTVALGGACNLNYDCKGNAFCDKGAEGSTCPGTCRASLGAGKTCLDSLDCVDGLICSASKCAAPLTEGSACAVETDCPIGLTCQGQGSARSCRSLASVYTGQQDEACDPSAGTLCQTSLVCASQDATTHACAPAAAVGGSCRIATPSQCPSGQYCKDADDSQTAPPSPGVDGVCADLPIDLQSCSVTSQCAPGAICLPSDQRCHAYTIAGEACVDASECYSGLCDNDSCVTPHDCTTM